MPMFPPNLPKVLLFPVLLFLMLVASAVSSPLSTIAISKVFNQTLVCALFRSPCGTRYELNCTALPGGGHRSYASGVTTYSAIAAGNGFLCALASLPSPNLYSMRWWNFTQVTNGSTMDSKRVYLGRALTALSAGDSNVCGIFSDTHKPYCWRWPQLSLPSSLNFSEIAVGRDFVCGLLSSGAVRCFGGDAGVVGQEPPGSYTTIAAGSRHACAISTEGELVCWGFGHPSVPKNALGIESLALGENRTCVLRANGTVACWGDNIAVPKIVADAQFIAIEAKSSAICGILLIDYSLVCWGNDAFHQKPVVFKQVLPGVCTAMSSCSCGVLEGSRNLCINAVICKPCKPIPRNSPNPPQIHDTGKSRVVYVVIGAAGLGICLAAVSCCLLYRFSKKSGRVHDSGRLVDPAPPPEAPGINAGLDLPEWPELHIDRHLGPLISKGHSSLIEEFSLEVLLSVTNGFSEEYKIGSGSFGSVYRAMLADGRVAAIKRAELLMPIASSSSSYAASVHKKRRCKESAFLSELALLSRVNHKNLVRLLGFCEEGQERILVYEFMTNGTLHDHLHRLADSPLSSWRVRLRAALDAARGIEYLHEYAVPAVIHRDIKSSNILLDSSWGAKVSDFGLSLMNTDDDDTSQAPTRAAGTLGYMDPEYYRLQHLTTKSDVYSFGVVLLELLTGSKVIQKYDESGTPRNVVEYAVPHIEEDRVHQVLDKRLPPPTPCEIEAVAYVGYLAADCVSPAGRDRPTMSEVVGALERALAASNPAASLARSVTTRSV